MLGAGPKRSVWDQPVLVRESLFQNLTFIFQDCCVTFWCGPCTTCQDAAQLGSMNPAYSVLSGQVQPITDQPL